MPVREVASKDNTRLKELRRALVRPARGLAGIEGIHLVQEALRAGLRLQAVFVARGAEPMVNALPLPPETEILLVPKKLLDAALATETPQPVAALVEMPQWSWRHILQQDQKETLVIVLAGLQDPGNLGTILRSSEAFAASGVVSLPGTVCAWNPKAVRASAGSVFRVPVLAASQQECLETMRAAGLRILATAVRNAEPATQAGLSGPVALVIGNEGNGLPEELAKQADARITIPCPGPVESLNAAVAASVLLYEAARQRAVSNSHSFSPAASRGHESPGRPGGKRGGRR